MKKLAVVIVVSLLTVTSHAQVGIDTTNPQAQLDIRSSNQATPTNTDGILIPKVNDFPAINPTAAQDGMLIFTTGIGVPTKGFYYWDNALILWVSIEGVKKIDDLIDGNSDNDGSEDGSSMFLGIGAGINDDSSDNKNIGIGYQSLNSNTIGASNTATGYQALFSNTSADGNVATGYQALYSNTTGGSNIATGYQTLYSNTTGRSNIATGYRALYSNTTGSYNFANGFQNLYSNTIGSYNFASGYQALYSNTIGDHNVAIGYRVLSSNTTGVYNIGTGINTLDFNTTGNSNIATGYQALYLNTIGSNNVANGRFTLRSNTIGNNNIASGDAALYYNTTGNSNIASGYQALFLNTTGGFNIANGFRALGNSITGDQNVAIGSFALFLNTTGSNNVAYGYQSLNNNLTGSNNIAIGYRAGFNETNSNRLYIENSDADTDDALIYGEFDTDILRFNGNVAISNANATHTNATISLNDLEVADLGASNLGLDGDIVPFSGSVSGFDLGNNTATEHWDAVVANTFVTYSDRNTKNNIVSLNYGLTEILQLQPVSYRYKRNISANNRNRLGLIAQDVEKIIPEVVITEDVDIDAKTGEKVITEGDYKAMSYTELIPVLVKAIQEQQQLIEAQNIKLEKLNRLEKEFYELKALLKKGSRSINYNE